MRVEKLVKTASVTLCEKYLYSGLFWSIFSRNQTEYEEILHISPYLVRMRENTDQNNSKYGQSMRNECASTKCQ